MSSGPANQRVLQSRQMTLRFGPSVEIVRNDWQNGQYGAVMAGRASFEGLSSLRGIRLGDRTTMFALREAIDYGRSA